MRALFTIVGAKTIIVLGSGKYRIGSSVEFDYATVGCVQTLKKLGYRTVVVNYNPETMSTDYDVTDALYFEELSGEAIKTIYEKEKAYGIVVSMGGQEPNNIAGEIAGAGLNIIGPNFDAIDMCEDRSKFSTMLDQLAIEQPAWVVATNKEDIATFVHTYGYPIIVRPSYVLSGSAMQIITSDESLAGCLARAAAVGKDKPVVLTKLIEGAREIEVDAVFCEGELVAEVVGEHVENAGVHSGDATLVIPPHTLDQASKSTALEIVRKIGRTLGISGICNTQLLAKNGWVGVIETNMRASRSTPFSAKATCTDLIGLATQAMVGMKVEPVKSPVLPYYGVKSPQFSFARLPGADPVLGIEMKSTGEVACFGATVEEAFMKSLVASRCGVKRKENQRFRVLGDDREVEQLISEYGHTITEGAEGWEQVDILVDCQHRDSDRRTRREGSR